jgi:hypothetical protein
MQTATNPEPRKYAYIEVQLLQPDEEHRPCGMPNCGKTKNGKWVEPLYHIFEARALDGTSDFLTSARHDLVICAACYTHLGHLATDAFMKREQKG